MGSGNEVRVVKGETLTGEDMGLSFEGVYNPDVIRAVNSWQREGILSWAKFGKENMTAENLYKTISDDEGKGKYIQTDSEKQREEVKDMCKRLIYGSEKGFFDLEDGKAPDMEVFKTAIKAIEYAGDLRGSGGVGDGASSGGSLHRQFHAYIDAQ